MVCRVLGSTQYSQLIASVDMYLSAVFMNSTKNSSVLVKEGGGQTPLPKEGA